MQDTAACLEDDTLPQRQQRLDVGDQALCLLLRVVEQTGGHLLSLPDHLLSGRDQLLIEPFLLFCKLCLLLFSRLGSRVPADEAFEPLDAHYVLSSAAGLFYGSHLPFYQRFGAFDETGKHPHALNEQATNGAADGCSSEHRSHPGAISFP